MVHALKEMHEYEHEESPNRPHLHHHCFDENLLFQLAILIRAGHSEISNMFVLLNGYCIMLLKLFPFPQKVLSSSGPLKVLMSQLCDTIFNF